MLASVASEKLSRDPNFLAHRPLHSGNIRPKWKTAQPDDAAPAWTGECPWKLLPRARQNLADYQAGVISPTEPTKQNIGQLVLTSQLTVLHVLWSYALLGVGFRRLSRYFLVVRSAGDIVRVCLFDALLRSISFRPGSLPYLFSPLERPNEECLADLSWPISILDPDDDVLKYPTPQPAILAVWHASALDDVIRFLRSTMPCIYSPFNL